MRARGAWPLIVWPVVLGVALTAPQPGPSGTPTAPAFCRPGPAGATPGPITARPMLTPNAGDGVWLLTPGALTPSPMRTPSTEGADRMQRPDVMTPSLMRTPGGGIGQRWTPSARTPCPMMPPDAGNAGRMDGQGERPATHLAFVAFLQGVVEDRTRGQDQLRGWRPAWAGAAGGTPKTAGRSGA
jgi:hypothetical protein